MNAPNALQWQLHAPGTQITFAASRDDNGYDLVMRKDDRILFTDIARDMTVLLEKSSRLRSHLQGLGYSTKPVAVRESQLTGGVCWGPAQPMEFSVLSVLAGGSSGAAHR